jgi:uncharacterized alpha-E superfamily protein
MLSRHAEDTFWAGRYLERAQDTARILDVTYHTLLSTPAVDHDDTWDNVLEVLGLVEPYQERFGPVDPVQVHEFLVVDRTNPGSIVSLVRQARENLRGVRELISSEVWETVNDLYLRLAARDVRRDLDEHPSQFYSLVKTGAQTIVGAIDETMTRDATWHFFHLGENLERAEMMCRLIDVHYRRLLASELPSSSETWRPLLRSSSAAEAYLRTGRGADAQAVVGFLLLSPTFPRSVLFSLRDAESHIESVSTSGTGSSKARRLLGRLRAEIEFSDVGEVLAQDLTEFLVLVQMDVRAVADAVATRFFPSVYESGLHAVRVRAGDEPGALPSAMRVGR